MKKYKKYIYGGIAVAVIALIWVASRGSDVPDYELGTVERSQLIQEVSVTGKVVTVEQRDLAFERTGKVSRVFVDVGDQVSAGALLASQDTSELQAQVTQAQAALDAERIALREIEQGTRQEEIQIAETTVVSAERSLSAAQTSLATVSQKAVADLEQVYDGTVTALQSAIVNARSALITIAELQEAHFDNFTQEGGDIAQKKAQIVLSLLSENSSGYWEAEFISDLDGGLFGEVRALDGTYDTEMIDVMLVDTLAVLTLVQDTLNMIPIKPEMTTAEKANLSAEKTTVSAEITAISGKEQSINVQRVLNESNINTAQTAVTTAENALLQAQDQLALKQSGSTEEQIAAQEARIRAQEATVALYQTQLSKASLYTPIAGFITKQNAKVGVIATAGTPVVSVMSSGNYEIEAYIPEADITKVTIDDIAHVTLDAYTDDTVLEAKIITIDPAETVIEGVPTYKVTFIITEGAELVKSGMTANIDIETEVKEGVLNIPTRAIVTEGNDKFVRIVDAMGQIDLHQVTVGLRSSDGRIEILDGLTEGQEIITFMSR